MHIEFTGSNEMRQFVVLCSLYVARRSQGVLLTTTHGRPDFIYCLNRHQLFLTIKYKLLKKLRNNSGVTYSSFSCIFLYSIPHKPTTVTFIVDSSWKPLSLDSNCELSFSKPQYFLYISLGYCASQCAHTMEPLH